MKILNLYAGIGGNKKLLLRNCVEPEVAEYIMQCLKDNIESQE